MNAALDCSAYFHRIGYAGPREPTLAVLRDLCAGHVRQIPFEGLDPFLGRAVDIDPAAIQNKLVHSRRGGYCHEQNALFHDVLAAMGFSVTALGARVVYASNGQPTAITHRLTRVSLPEGVFIADVGFGGQTPTAPLRLEPDLEQVTSHGIYRILHRDAAYELQMKFSDRWEGLYRFTLQPQTRVDFEVANWFTSTHPRSRFTQNLIACRVVGTRRINLFNLNFAIREADGRAEQRTLTTARELADVLENAAGIALPAPIDTIWEKVANSSRPAAIPREPPA
jgi:N-hydroxyarylamine O-acetyltransferase